MVRPTCSKTVAVAQRAARPIANRVPAPPLLQVSPQRPCLPAGSLSKTQQLCLHLQDSHSLRTSCRGQAHTDLPARATGAYKTGFPDPQGRARVSHATTPALALRAPRGSLCPAFQGRAPLFSLAGGSGGPPFLLRGGSMRIDHVCPEWPHSMVFPSRAPTQTPGPRRQASHSFPTLISSLVRQRE